MKYTLEHFKRAVEQQPTTWLQGCIAQPSKHWRRIHVAIIQSELKKRRA